MATALLVLSCQRPILLNITLHSLFLAVPESMFEEMFLLDCQDNIFLPGFKPVAACSLQEREPNIMCNVEKLYRSAKTKYVFFTEDDWFYNSRTLKHDIAQFKQVLDEQDGASTVQLTGLDQPFHHNKTRGMHETNGMAWAWTNCPAGPGGSFGAWTNNPHFGRSRLPPPLSSHEASSSILLWNMGYTNVQTTRAHVKHIGQNAHVYHPFRA